MAGRAQPLSGTPGSVTAIAIAVAVTVIFSVVALRAEATQGLSSADWAAIRFTLGQAFISAGISTLLAIPVARALARRQFPGRGLVVTLLGAPFILPVVVAVTALLAVFGRNGWLNGILTVFGLEPVQIYGAHGVVLAHVFFNLPLATRLLLQGWFSIPSERFRLAAQLGFGSKQLWTVIERPMLIRVAPGVFGIILSVCMTSFAVALTLGGGPRATTIELAIYQAFRFDFDLGKAALLGLIQIGLIVVVMGFSLNAARQDGFGSGLDRPRKIWGIGHISQRLADTLSISLVLIFLLVPIVSFVPKALPGLFSLPAEVWGSAVTSLQVAAMSTFLALVLAFPIAVRVAMGRGHVVELVGLLGLVTSPLVLGTGLFVLLNPWVNPAKFTLFVTASVNALMSLPFVIRVLSPAIQDCLKNHGKLCLSLGITNASFLRLVLLPRLAGRIGFCAGLSAALSMGDLGVVALFADPEIATLPLQVVRLMGAYRMGDAASAGLLLMLLSFGVFAFLDNVGRRYAGD